MMYDIKQIADIIGAECCGVREGSVSDLLTDSRRLSFPEATLFFALKTGTNDGHRYISDLYSMGVRFFVVSALPREIGKMPAAGFLLVKDVLEALQKLAAYHRSCFGIPVIGITGSNGKSIVKEFLYQLLCGRYNIVRSPRSYNSQIGVPLSVWGMGEDNDLAIFEAGISMPGEMQKLEPIIRPEIGLLTNIGSAHQENFSSLRQKAEEKLTLFRSSEHVILNRDCRDAVAAAEDAGIDSSKLFFWSMEDSDADLYVASVARKDASSIIIYRYGGKERTVEIPFTDDASVEDVISAICVIACLDPSLLDSGLPFGTLEPVAMRLEVKPAKNGSILINDAYNSDVNSLRIALDFQFSRKKDKGCRTTLILSDILQSGSPARKLYADVAGLVKAKGVDRLIGIGSQISSCADLFDMDKEFYLTTEDFLASPHFNDFHDEIILLKGSRSFHFESIAERMERRLHETIMEVNLDALVHNFNWYRARLKPETKMVCMVKASAYGAGAIEVAKTLQDHRCDYLAVAVADEGIDLRNAGITIPVMVMNPEISSLNMLFSYSLEPEIYSFRLLEAFIHEAEKAGVKSYPIHVKIDTGMHRLGFTPDEIPQLCRLLSSQKYVSVKSVFSHLAGSDSPEFRDFTMKQLNCFKDASSKLEELLGHKVIKHILNSAGIERYTDWQMDMVRLGIGLYGVSASGMDGLRNVSTLKTTILQIRNVPAGDSIGYSRRTFIDRDSRIAIIPIGYADGLDRHFSNRNGKVMINGQFAPIVGNICMDACMIDVTDIDAAEGDTVVIFGDDLPVSELAEKLGTIPYEILTSPSPRVERVYYRE